MTEQATQLIANNIKEYLQFLKTKFKLYHLSNVFFRDMHYGTMEFLKSNRIKLYYLDAEIVTKNIIAKMMQQGLLHEQPSAAYTLNYPEFALPKKEVAPPAPKPAPAAPPVATPVQAS